MKRIALLLMLFAIFALAGSGGPDGGGYYWYDQDELPNLFDDNWVDISSTGTPHYFSDDDWGLMGTLSWDFTFYGTDYADIYASDNGAAYFVDDYFDYECAPIPSDHYWHDVETHMSLWWTDMYGPGGGAVYWEDFGDHFVVMWHDYDVWGAYDIDAEIIGWESQGADNSDIMFLYNFTYTESWCSVGIQGDPSTGTQLQYCPVSVTTGDGYLLTVQEPDDTPPEVSDLDPDDGDSDVPVDTDIVFHCTDDSSGINTDTIDFTAEDTTLSAGRVLSAGAGGNALSVGDPSPSAVIPGDLDIDDSDPLDVVCTFTPDDDLPLDETITCTVDGGLADNCGNEMGDDFVWTFDTEVAVEELSWGAVKAEF